MSKVTKIRWRWLKGMYIYTAALSGTFGLGILTAPKAVESAFDFPDRDPIVLGIVGSVYVAFGILSLFGLRAPLKFVPILLLQLLYKLIWFLGVALPLCIRGQFPSHGLLFVPIFVTYVIGDLIAIPFSQVFSRERTEQD